MTGEQTIDGKITQVSNWNSGKGCFVKLDTLDTDFFKFGGFTSQVGALVKIHYKQGTGNYSDKLEILRSEKLGGPAEPVPGEQQLKGFVPASNLPRQNLKSDEIAGRITRSVTLKCASQLWAQTLKVGDRTSLPELAQKVIETARELEDYIETGADSSHRQ